MLVWGVLFVSMVFVFIMILLEKIVEVDFKFINEEMDCIVKIFVLKFIFCFDVWIEID